MFRFGKFMEPILNLINGELLVVFGAFEPASI